MHATFWPRWLFSLALLGAPWAAQADFPAGYAPGEGLVSPSGQYSILLPDEAHLADPNPYDSPNYLADLTANRLIGQIKGCYYWPHANHLSLDATWRDDSQAALVEMGERYGFGDLILVEVSQGALRQTTLGREVQRQLDAVVRKANKGKEEDLFATAYYQFRPHDEIQLYAAGATNPKQFETQPFINALFQGRYSTAKHRWLAISTRIISEEQEEDLGNALTKLAATEAEEGEDKLGEEALDKRLNQVYRALHLVLPAERFAKVKQEQKAWPAKRDAEQNEQARRDVIRRRVIELQALFW